MNIFDKIVRINTTIIGLALVLSIIGLPFDAKGMTLNIQFPKLNLHKPSVNTAQVAGVYAQYAPSLTDKPSRQPTESPTPTPTPSPTPILITRPVHIEIPSLGISTNIVNVGITPEYAMDIPKDVSTVGWYENSVKPGELGNAILNGHFDDTSGNPAVFYNIEDLEVGDKIIITTETQQTFIFSVDRVFSHPLEDFPTDIVYGQSEGTGLKLITCDGVWDHVRQSYSDRLVVITKLVRGEQVI